MPLDRMSIEKKDFPVGRRGYDPGAVDSHLREIAEEVEELKRSASARTETLAGVASVRVQAIVDAAEQSSVEIRRLAEEEARTTRDEAAKDAQREREEALRQSREYVANVSDAAAQLRTQLETMESELGALTDSLRTGANRLSTELEAVEAGMNDLGTVAGGKTAPRDEKAIETALPGAGELEPEPALAAAEPEPQAVPAGAPEQDEEISPSEPITAAELEPDPELEPETELEPEPLSAQAGSDDVVTDGKGTTRAENEEPTADTDDAEGARLIALNMALNGTPREETDRYLAENFELSARGKLLDEVYASVEG